MRKKLLNKLLFFLVILFLTLPLSKSSWAVDISSTDLIGLRGGVWKVEEARGLPDTIEAKTYTPYLELFISYGLKKGFSLELNLGAGYRGDTKFIYEDGYYWENWNLYPISGKIKYSFLSFNSQNNFQPYLDLGLTFLTSTSTYNDPYYLDVVHVRTKSTLGALAGWGMDLSLSSRILLNLDFQYRWVSFNQEIAGIKNYSGPQLTFGMEYIIKRK
jgi:outer membrane protein W